MSRPDFNQLLTLNVLLAEGNVARAAARLKLSPSAMSRALARLRQSLGDPLLVRAGRGLVPTPRALELRDQVGQLVDQAEAVLRPVRGIDLRALERTFTLRTSDGFVENFGAPLVARLRAEAPRARLRFVPKLNKDSELLRDGSVDLETGVIGGATGPEVRTRALFQDRFIGVVRHGHRLAKGRITAERYAGAQHVLLSRRGQDRGPIDDHLRAQGLEREIVAMVGGFAGAIALARASDLVATVPERHTGNLRAGMFSFELPVQAPRITVSMLWHPRMDADPAHRWLRGCVLEVCSVGA